MISTRAVAAAALLGLCAAAWGVGPPSVALGRLWRERGARLDRLRADQEKAVFAGEMGRALRLAQEVESMRRRWQGPRNWQAVDARLEVERWSRLARLPEAAQREEGRAARQHAAATELQGRGQNAAAEKASREVLAIRLKALGEEHPVTADSYNYVAFCLHHRGKLAEAQPLYEKALAIRRKALGEEHPDTAVSYNNVATCLRGRGKAAEALSLHEKALAIRRKSLGEEHPGTATSYTNLADCLAAFVRHREAQPLLEEALAIRRKLLGEESPVTADSYGNLGGCLIRQGKAAEAQPLLEKALGIFQRALGEWHPTTATGYSNLASCLKAQGQSARAQPLFEKALGIYRKVLSEEHPFTATSYNNVASCLQARGKVAEAQPLFEKALAINRKVWSEEHPSTADAYGQLAACLREQGKAAQAQVLEQKALDINRKVRGEHPFTADCYVSVASCLAGQGNYSRALPLYEKALAINRKALGEGHIATAAGYNNLATCLSAQGKEAVAQPLYEKALAIYRKERGEGHASTVHLYNSLAVCLDNQGKVAAAQPLFEKALAIRRKVLGEGHLDTAESYRNAATSLREQGKVAEAQPLYEKVLAIRRKALGEGHPKVAESYTNLAGCLRERGKVAQAQGLYEKALAINRKALGDQHPGTARSCNALAFFLEGEGKHREAIPYWEQALLGHDFERLARADTGFGRARGVSHTWRTPREGLALAYARLKEPGKAWRYAEADLARNLLDDLAGGAAEDVTLLGHLRDLEERLAAVYGLAEPTEDQKQLREELPRQLRDALKRLAARAAERSAANVWSLERVQGQLPADGALVLWVGARDDRWGCVLRARGEPRWERLAGSGPGGAWSRKDHEQAQLLEVALADVRSSAARRGELAEAVRKRWVAPLERHLKAEGKMPAVRRLFVVPPSRWQATLPVEVLAPGYTVSYTPSATVLAQALKGHRALKATPALALGDPVFRAPVAAAAPKQGVLVTEVQPGGAAEKAGLRPGDVLVRHGGARLGSVNDLVAALKKGPKGEVTYWREGKEATAALRTPPGLRVDPRPAPEAVRAFREANAPVVRGRAYAELKGTRAEVGAIRRLLGEGCRALLGSEASEQALDGMRGELKSFRVLHLATHGEIDPVRPERSRLVLAQDRLPGVGESAVRAARGLRPYTGVLTVDAVLRDWRLDADLVVLSACQTGLGAASTGDGLLGFPYALMRVGARSVVLSRWKVDDEATALLMVRFYENLVGKAKGLRGPLGRTEALAEAKRWLAGLGRKEAERLAGALGADRLSGTRGSIVDLDVKERPKVPAGERPYEHPFYWAAFTLVGDPD